MDSSPSDSSPSTQNRPALTPAFCFNTTVLQDFLRLSRSSIDDTINQNLNALLTPGSTPFNPRSTSTRALPGSTHRKISAATGDSFKDQLLFPAWQARADVLNYCAGVATSPDPQDPEHVLREVEDARARERVVDERLDPYSARYFPREARTETLAGLLRNERMVEGIVRARTWGIVGERCEGSGTVEEGWERALDKWRKRRAGSA